MTSKIFPVIEVFGPVLQGEGAMIGVQTLFVRFGGCDYKCSMCDSFIAVDKLQIRERATKMDAQTIFSSCLNQNMDKGSRTRWVTLSGGNPLLWELSELVSLFHQYGWKVAVETQGSIYKHWVNNVDTLTVSPKGPGMGFPDMPPELDAFKYFYLNSRAVHDKINIKVVVFGHPDLIFANILAEKYSDTPIYLSIGNPHLPQKHVDKDLQLHSLLASLRWAEVAVLKYKHLDRAIVLPQMHVLAHGNKEGV